MAYGNIAFDMQKTTVYIDPEIQRGLRALSRAQRRPQAELIREALSHYLDRVATTTYRHGSDRGSSALERTPPRSSGEARTEWAAAARAAVARMIMFDTSAIVALLEPQ